MQNYILREAISDEARKLLAPYNDFMAHLLFHRDVKTADEAAPFIDPKYETSLHDPFLMKNMEKAVERIAKAVDGKEKVAIYADYDCDGIPGAVVLNDLFKKLGHENISVYIPHRYKEGYGMNVSAIHKLVREGVKLIITVDCGITDVLEVAEANSFDVDVIVTDHHLPQAILPEAYAILDPKQAGETYPFDSLCGAGVAFKLAQAFLKKHGERFGVAAGWEKWLLDMVGISTIADMVPLRGENRALATFGLKVLRISPRLGLAKLFARAKVRTENLTEDDIGFMLAPRINAASRMSAPMHAFQLLSSTDDLEAGNLANYLEEKNSERKEAVANMMREIETAVAKNHGDSPVIVIGNKSWQPGVVGLAASRIAEKYKKPAFVWGMEGSDGIKGSCRSDGLVNMVELMTAANDMFLEFGGHALAGGFSLHEGVLENISAKLAEAYVKIRGEGQSEMTNDLLFVDGAPVVDMKLALSDVNWEKYGTVEKLAPYGIGNPKPVFLFEGIEVAKSTTFGAEANHLRIEFKKADGGEVSAITFHFKDKCFGTTRFAPGDRVNLVATMDKNTFGRNNQELRLRIVDIVKV